MTAEDAKYLLVEYTPVIGFVKYRRALNTAVEALERDIAKAPLNIQGNPVYGECPSCGKTVLRYLDSNGCRQCLQRLNWTNI